MSPGVRAAFDTREEAEAAQARLVASGVYPAGIQLLQQGLDGAASGRGLFDQITNLLAPEQVRTPGAFLLSAEVLPDQLERATRALEGSADEKGPNVAATPEPRIEDRTYDFIETAEELVVEKQLFVREEIVFSKSSEEHVEEVFDTVRRTEVEIERLEPAAAGATDQSGRKR